MSLVAAAPYPLFSGLDNRLLDNGYVWFGLENQDPQTHPIGVYADAAMTIPLAQPLRTKSGMLSNGGPPVTVYVAGPYSIRVRSFTGAQVYYLPSVSGRSEAVSFLDYPGSYVEKFEAAVREVHERGGGEVNIPAGDYQINGVLVVPYSVCNVTIRAYGTTLRNARLSIQGGYGQLEAQYITWLGGTITEDSGSDAKWLIDIVGKDVLLRDVRFRCINGAGVVVPKPGYMGFLRVDAINGGRSERVTLDNVEFDGSNGLLIAGNGHRIRNCHWKNASLYTTAFGGDDAAVIKAIDTPSFDIEITSNTFEGYAGICSIGSEVGKRGVDDPTHGIHASDILVANNKGRRCASLIYVKPGAINQPGLAYDFRNGLISKIRVEGNDLEDLNGERMLTPIAIHMGRGSKLGSIDLINNTIRGRMSKDNSSALNAVMQVMIRDLGAGSSVESINVDGLHFIDPTESVDANGTNGYRPRFFLQAENETASGGAIKTIRLNNITCNGTAGCAIYVGAGVQGRIVIGEHDLLSCAQNPPSSIYDACIVDNSGVVKVEGDGVLASASPATIPIKVASGLSIASRKDPVFIGDVPASTQGHYPWTAPLKAQVVGLSFLNGADLGLDSSNYRAFSFRRRRDGVNSAPFLAKNTLEGDASSTGGFIAGVAKLLNPGVLQTADSVFEEGDVLSLDFTADEGASTVFTQLRLVVHFVPLERASA